jgi:hypothetical protein
MICFIHSKRGGNRICFSSRKNVPAVIFPSLTSYRQKSGLQRLNLTDSQQGDAITYEPGQIVEFHRIAKGAVRGGVQEKRFESGEQWEVLRREEGAAIVEKDGLEKLLPLDEARNFSVFEPHVGLDTKNRPV